MAVQHSSLGLRKIEIAEVDPAAIPAAWTELEDAKIDSATLTENEPSTEDIRIEQRRGVYRTITTEEGSTVFTVELYDVSADNIARLKGGTVSPADAGAGIGRRWSSKDAAFEVSKAVRLETLDGYRVYIPNAKVQALITFQLSRSGLATMTLTATAQDHPMGDVIVEEPVA